MDTNSLIQRLETTRDESLALYALDQTFLDRTYGSGKWSIRYILHHLADAECVFYQRIARVLSGESTVKGFDQDAWCMVLDYEHRPLQLSKAAYAACRDLNIHHVRRSFEAEGHRPFAHATRGDRTLGKEMEKIAMHNRTHLDQIDLALNSSP